MEYEITASIPAHIRDLLRSGETGEVLLVSSSGIYLRFGEQILLLCDESWGVLPIGIGVKDFEKAVSILRPQQGQPVTVAEDRLIFPSGKIHLILRQLSCQAMCSASPPIRYIRQAAEELAALELVLDEDLGVAYSNYMCDWYDDFIMVKYYTNADLSKYEDTEIYDFVDDLDQNDMAKLRELADVQYSEVTDMECRLVNNVKRVFESEHSLSGRIMKSFGFLLDGRDLTESLAEAQKINEQMLEHVGDITKAKT